MVSSSPALVEKLRHAHNYGAAVGQHETRTRWVVVLTAAMMIGELLVGYVTNSLALTADGWHMATHAGALGLAALAYWFARTRSGDAVFSFGTGKVHALVGYTNAIVLAVVALWMIYEAAIRLVAPEPVAFAEALPVAVVGLFVNLASMLLLHSGEHHDHADGHHQHADDHHQHADDHHQHADDHHQHADDHHQHADDRHQHADDHHQHADGHHDHNLRAAYLHVLADAFTSVLAIVALLGGRYFGWSFLDPLMGIVGGVVISRWSYQLCRGAARQLLDVVPSTALASRIRAHLQREPGTEVLDLHVWEIGPNTRACLASLIASEPRAPFEYAERLRNAEQLAHITIEVHRRESGVVH
jgi:cation diffusion facilitator family transporter